MMALNISLNSCLQQKLYIGKYWRKVLREGPRREMDLETYSNVRKDERDHNLLCVLQKKHIGKCRRKGHTDRGSILVCHREGIEKEGWAWGGRERGNLNTWKAVGKVKVKIAALTHPFSHISVLQKYNYISICRKITITNSASVGFLTSWERKAPIRPSFTTLYQTCLSNEDKLFKRIKKGKKIRITSVIQKDPFLTL